MKKQLKSLLLITLLVGMTASAWAQSSTEGKEFWVGLTLSIRPPGEGDGEATPYLAISTKEETKVTINNPSYPNWSIEQTIPANRWLKVDIPKGMWYPEGVGNPSKVKAHADELNNYGIHVKADKNISVFAIIRAGAGMDASNILPITAIQTHYILQDYIPHAKSGDNPYMTMATILATEDNTEIQLTTPNPIVTKSSPVIQPLPGGGYKLTLKKGQTYYLMAENNGTNNYCLSGTEIEANKPIAVFQGVPCTFVPHDVGNRDCLYEQAMPVDYWGTEFVATRSYAKGANFIRVTASEPNQQTTITINGKTIRKTLSKGQTYEIELRASDNMNNQDKYVLKADTIMVGDYAHIKTSCPCAVYSYDVGRSYTDKDKGELDPDGEQQGDPSSVWIAPVEQAIDQITFGVCGTNEDSGNQTVHHYMDIVVPTDYAKQTEITPAPRDPKYDVNTSYIQIPKTSYSYARIYLTKADGDSKAAFTVSNPGGLIAHVYGNGKSESYAYSVGSSAITQGIKVDGSKYKTGTVISDKKYCLHTPILFDAKVGTDVITQVNWNFGDGITEYNGSPQTSHQYTSVGWFDVTADLFGHQACDESTGSVPLGSVTLSICVRSDTTYVFEHDCKDADYEGELEDEIVIDDDTCYSIKVRYISWGKHSKRDELITREDIFVDEYTGETYTENAEYDVNLTDLFGTKNHTDCDSIIHRTVKILTCIDLEIPNDSANQHACQGEQLYIPFTQSKGERDYSYAEINNQRIDIRFDDYDVILPVEDLKPGRYKATIYVYDAFCDNLHAYPIDFAVFYPKDIFIYKFGNVMAVLNQANNGGYDFRGYQWYLNGVAVPDATSAVYQVDGSFAKGDLVYVNLLDKDGMWLPSCPQEVTEVPDFTPEANNAPAQKLLLNDQMVIRKDDRIFNIFGQRVK